MSSGEPTPTLTWSATFNVSTATRPSSLKLPGDKLLLPPSTLEQLLAAAPVTESLTDGRSQGPLTSTFDPFNPYTYAAERYAREQFRDRQPQLPHPLTFRLINPENGHTVYAGIREFSADEGEVVLSEWLRTALGIRDTTVREGDSTVKSNGVGREDTVMTDGHAEGNGVPARQGPIIRIQAQQLQKGTFVKLRPLEAGYDAEDWKALLEQHLRHTFTTLTKGEVLSVPGGRGLGASSEAFKFLVDEFRPEGDGICIVDTDLEVDIEALNEEQARETVKRLAQKAYRAPGTENGSSSGGRIDLFQSENGRVLDGEWVDYQLPSWDRSQGIDIELFGVDGDSELDLFVSPLAPRQRAKPRDDEYVFAEIEGQGPKRIRIMPTNTKLEDAEAIQISIHAYQDASSKTPRINSFTISVNPFDSKSGDQATSNNDNDTVPNPGEARCKNCHQWIPQRTMMLHENFCYRNNILCPKGCNQVFQKTSPEWKQHWHCEHDSSWGNKPLSKIKHDQYQHTPATCPSCERSYSSISALARHRTTICPGKLILCRFCHLQVPQEGDPDAPDASAILSGLTPHELADGARTTDCHLCGKIVRLRDMRTHLAHHELSKSSRPAPLPCRNDLCGRTVHGAALKSGETRVSGHSPPNAVGLCGRCFGPLYVSMHDPDGRALRRRIERRYLTQLLTGCGKAWCANGFCRAGRKNQGMEERGTSTKEALPMTKPELAGLDEGSDGNSPLHFCVDEQSQKNKAVAEYVAAEGVYELGWCVGALEAARGDVSIAREWLSNWAPGK